MVGVLSRQNNWILAFLVLAAIVPFTTSSRYVLDVGINLLIILSLAFAFDLVVGRIGALSFAQPIFFGVGAYVAAIASTSWGFGFWSEVAAAAVMGLALSLAIGIPAFRLNLHAFAIGTIGFATIAQLVAMNWMSVTNGPAFRVRRSHCHLSPGRRARCLSSTTSSLALPRS